ncbi:FkbM family methyltransferase [Lachnospira multipara]|uniref:FkbM family methyltransferase n=1 Tax=Lachnospira multipara TaxID=28051 RepID=UPI0004147DA0|nr:FkbM family methyltransferase [Lachnospira multipara]
MFQDYIVDEYLLDVNGELIEKLKNSNADIFVYGCGSASKTFTDFLNRNGLSVTAYLEGKQYFKKGKVFLNKSVYLVDDIYKQLKEANIVVRATGADVVHIMNDLKSKMKVHLYSYVDRNQQYTMTAEWVVKHKEELNRIYDLFEDEESKLVFRSFIGARANNIKRESCRELISLWTSEQYFNDLYPKELYDEHILIDCGAYIGDTAIAFYDFLKNDGKEILVRAFEMEDDNFKELDSLSSKYKNLFAYKIGLGDKHEKYYYERKNDASVLVDYETENLVEIAPLDSILDKDSKVSFIKMDIEGFEEKALIGMKNTIINNKATLAICVYHKLDDLIRLPQLIKSYVESSVYDVNYKYYLRHHSHSAAELVFYAVPCTQ